MRLFVAIEIAPEIREKITGYISRLKPAIANARWAHTEGIHITLKFLGNVPDTKRVAIENTLRGIQSSKFSLSVRGVGVFPNARAPRILWAGIESGPQLAKLAALTGEALALLGFEREQRTFTPHVTLARFHDRSSKADVSAALSDPTPSFGTMTAAEFHLYESRLSPQGSQYFKLSSFALT